MYVRRVCIYLPTFRLATYLPTSLSSCLQSYLLTTYSPLYPPTSLPDHVRDWLPPYLPSYLASYCPLYVMTHPLCMYLSNHLLNYPTYKTTQSPSTQPYLPIWYWLNQNWTLLLTFFPVLYDIHWLDTGACEMVLKTKTKENFERRLRAEHSM